ATFPLKNSEWAFASALSARMRWRSISTSKQGESPPSAPSSGIACGLLRSSTPTAIVSISRVQPTRRKNRSSQRTDSLRLLVEAGEKGRPPSVLGISLDERSKLSRTPAFCRDGGRFIVCCVRVLDEKCCRFNPGHAIRESTRAGLLELFTCASSPRSVCLEELERS